MTDYTACSDEELMLKLKNGEREIMDYIIEKYKYLVRKNAKAMFLIGGDADDLIQEGMIGLFKAIQDYDAKREASFVTFANLCINRQLYSAVKASNRKKHLPLNTYVSLYSEDNDSEQQLIERISSEETENPEVLWIDQENFMSLQKKLFANLSGFEKRTLEFYLEGLNYQQIAIKLGKTEKSVDNALHRIRRKMRELLQ